MESKFSFKVKPYKIFMNNVDLGFCGRLNILLYNAFKQEEEACKEKNCMPAKLRALFVGLRVTYFFLFREIRNCTKQVIILPSFYRFAKLKKYENRKKNNTFFVISHIFI